ncbi:MAG: hypothetical protein WC863_00945 [Patescibacteria group bacterium]
MSYLSDRKHIIAATDDKIKIGIRHEKDDISKIREKNKSLALVIKNINDRKLTPGNNIFKIKIAQRL